MTCHAIRTTLAAALLVSMVAPLPLRADPITVTGGTVEVYASIRQARITFVGNDFRLETGTEDFFTFVGALSPFPAGTAVNLGGVWRPTDLRGGEAIVNGVHYEEIYFGNLQSGGTFTTSSVVLSGGEGFLTVKLPFTFTGFVTGFSSINAQPEDVVFTASLVGSGTATAGFSNHDPALYWPSSLPGRDDAQLAYVFSPAAVPEPGTLALLGTGLAPFLVAAYRRRSTRGKHAFWSVEGGRAE